MLYSDWKVQELTVSTPGTEGAFADPYEDIFTQPPPPPPPAAHDATQVLPPELAVPVAGCTVFKRIVPELLRTSTLISEGNVPA